MIDVKERIKITPTPLSRIQEIKGEAITFGRIFSDHMFTSDFIDNDWVNSSISPYGKLSLDPSCLVFHYGQAIFEGMKAYRTKITTF